MSLHVIMQHQFNMRQWSETLAHQIAEFSDNQNSCFSRPPYPTTGWGGRWKPNHSNLTWKPNHSKLTSKPMDAYQQVGTDSVQTPDKIPESQPLLLPPIWKKKVCGWLQLTLCGCKQVEWWKESVRLSSEVFGSNDRWQESFQKISLAEMFICSHERCMWAGAMCLSRRIIRISVGTRDFT